MNRRTKCNCNVGYETNTPCGEPYFKNINTFTMCNSHEMCNNIYNKVWSNDLFQNISP